jgi:hypothetical protein
MTKFTRALVMALVGALGMTSLTAAEKPEPVKEEKPKDVLLKTIIDAKAEFDKDKKKLTIDATGQVPTGGWKGAKLTPRVYVKAPADGIWEFDMTAVRPEGIVTQVVSKVKATHTWENPPAELKGIKIYGEGEGVKTVKIEK